MYYTLFICFALGMIFLFFPKQDKKAYAFHTERKILKRSCATRNVHCVDSCDFLCLETGYECVDGLCKSTNVTPTPCSSETGGIVVLTEQNDSPFWICICTEPSFFGGADCSVRVADLCEGGQFTYFDPEHYECRCPADRRLMKRNNKPYCVLPQVQKFFKFE